MKIWVMALVCLCTLFGMIGDSAARDWSEGLTGSIGSGTDQMVYRYYLPGNYDPNVEYPLVLFMHGTGESGTNNSAQVANHIGPLIDKTEFEYPAILVAPQLNLSTGWSPDNFRDRTDEVLQTIASDHLVDSKRMYVTGLSMGGFGTMEYLHSFNHENPSVFEFAAAAPLSGAFAEPLAVSTLVEIPVWMAHGTIDNIVNIGTSRGTFRIIQGLSTGDPIIYNEQLLGGPTAVLGNTRLTEIVGGGHAIWSPVYADNDLYDWMFAQALEVPDVDFNDDDVLDCADIDSLMAEIDSGANEPDFDLTSDGLVDLADRDAWLRDAGRTNGLLSPYKLGDATLDGIVDGLDFVNWNLNKFTSGTEWCQGNFNGDNAFDGLDYIAWNNNKFTSSEAVPEPTGALGLVVSFLLVGLAQRCRP